MSTGEQERLFDESKILMLTGLSDLKLYNPETDECLRHEEDIPNLVASRDPEVSILITTHNRLGYLFNCISSIKASCRAYEGKYEVIVVDDASTDRTSWLLSRIRGLKVVSLDTNMGFVRANNLGARNARGDQVVLLNNDTIVASGWLKHLLKSFQEHSEIGAVGSKLVYPSGVLQEAGAIVWNDATGWNYGRDDDSEKSEYQHVRDVDYCSAASLAVRRSLIRRTGVFDERFHPGYYEDTDLCFYVRSMKKRVLYQPKSVVVHFEGVSHGRETSADIKKYQVVNRDKFLEKWKLALQKQFSPDPRNVLRARDRATQKSILVFDHGMLEHDANSGDLRMYSVLNLLKSMSWNVTFFPGNRFCAERYADDLRQRGIEVFCERTPVEDFLCQRRNYYDFVLMSRVDVAGDYIDAVSLWSPQSVLVIDFPDLASVRESRYAQLMHDEQRSAEAEKISLKETELARRADLVITITETERKRLLERDSNLRVEVIPNVHELGSDGMPFEERRDLLFLGGYEHQPNVDAVLFMVNEIFPLIRKSLRNVQLLVAGSKMPEEIRNIKAPGVRMLGYVKDLTPLLSSCKVFVSPLRYGAGLKGKIGMAMAAGLPVVTSSIGAEGIKDSRRKLLLVADSPEDFAKCVVQLFTDRRLWERLSKDARSYVQQRYSPEVIKRKLVRLGRASPVNLSERVSRVFGDPLGTLLSIYYSREDLRRAFPEVSEGDYSRLLDWAREQAVSGEDNAHQLLASDAPWYEANPWHSLSKLSEELNGAKNRIANMESSLGWKLLLRYRRFNDKWFPLGTRRRGAIEKAALGLKIGLDEGSRSLLRKFLNLYVRRRSLNDQYQVWLLNNDLTDDRLAALRREALAFNYGPKISIIMPVRNTDLRWLEAAIESVLRQVYTNWELCIVDNASTKKDLKRVLETYARSYQKIKVLFLDENLGISGASNKALDMADGEFVGLLDHDDELSSDALLEVVRALNENPDLDLIYSDEDKIDLKGRRVEPFFKPDWSPDLFLSMNYVCHFTVIRKRLIDRIGGFRRGFEGSQDHDLILRVAELTNKIHHIQRPLYHWRKVPGSAAASAEAKPYARQTALRAVSEALARRGLEGEAIEGLAYFRVKYAIKGSPLVTIIIPTKNNVDLLKRCIESIESKTSYKNYEIIVVDNQSTDPDTLAYLKEQPHKVVSFDSPFNFSRMNNFAAEHARGEHLLFLNNDTEVVNAGWLEAMVEHSQRPEVGMVGSLLLYPGESVDQSRIQHAGVVIGVGGVAGHAFKYLRFGHDNYFNLHKVIRNCTAVTAACAMIRRSVFNEVGGFDENLKVAFGDVDLCLRLREKGYLIVYTPYSMLFHYESASRGALHPTEDENYTIDRWSSEIIKGDPYYNPNLSLLREDYSLACTGSSVRPLLLLLDIYHQRADLQKAYPEVYMGDYRGLIGWAATTGITKDEVGRPLRAYASYYTSHSRIVAVAN